MQSRNWLKIDILGISWSRDAAADDATLQLRTGLHPTARPDNAVLQLRSGFNHGPSTNDIDATQNGPSFDLRCCIERRAINAIQGGMGG